MILKVIAIETDDPDNMVIRFQGDDNRRYVQRQKKVNEILNTEFRRTVRYLFDIAVTGNQEDLDRLIGRTISVVAVKPTQNGGR